MNIILFAFMTQAQQNFLPVPDVKMAGEKSLDSFRKVVTEKNFQKMGFNSLEEVRMAELGKELGVFIIGLNDLKNFKQETILMDIIQFGNEVLIPVNVKNEVRSSIMLTKSGDSWETASYGGSNKIKLLVNTISRIRGDSPEMSGEFRVIVIPAMNLYFIGLMNKDTFFLAPVLDDESLGFKAGSVMNAEEVLLKLVPVAERMKDEPG